MDDHTGHFYGMVAEVFRAAELAGLPVNVTTAGGRSVAGVPSATDVPMGDEREWDHSGIAGVVSVDGVALPLDEITGVAIQRPA
ncbi:MAG: hypothetical protein QOF76_2946 [Solirubrobacteraceae bacterium]|jgi:hypothetical protein|nr:hypothetical protein [Solirubrobacteraceae bacterium]